MPDVGRKFLQNQKVKHFFVFYFMYKFSNNLINYVVYDFLKTLNASKGIFRIFFIINETT